MTSNSSLGNVISRLQGLKNVSGRRVMPGAEFLQDMETTDNDVSGTAPPLPNFANFSSPKQNLPEEDLGGEITPQSYDVRANTVEKTNEDPGFFSKLGQALSSIFVTPVNKTQSNAIPESPPIETAQVDMKEGIPQVTASQQEFSSPVPNGVLDKISNYLGKDYASTDASLIAQGKNPDIYRENVPIRSPEEELVYQQNLKSNETEAMKDPWMHSQYGSASEVANSPALKAEFKTVTGIDYEPQIAQQVSEYELAMKGVEDSLQGINTQLDERANGIKQRILSNQSTDADKYYIGLALLMPLLVGGFFGKEAALGALSGGAKGFSDILGRRQKESREDEASLLDINRQQGTNQEKLANMNMEKAKLEPSLRKALPEQPNAHLIGTQYKEWQDPITGKEMQGYEIKPGLVARPQFVNSKEGKADMLKAANELSQVKTFVKEVDDLTSDISEIVSQLKDSSNIKKAFVSFAKDKIPGSLSALTEDVMFDGRKQNAGTLLEEKLGFLANAYGMAKEIGQLDRAAQAHIKKIIDNPTSTLLTPRDALNQVLEVRKLSQKGLLENAANKGFYPEFIIQDLESRNNELFGGLNKKEQNSRLAERKKQLLQSE